MAVGETRGFLWDYSEKSDILNIRIKAKKVKGSAELGDFTVDFDKEGRIVGIEIMNVSGFLKQIEISKEQLSKMKGAEMIIKQRKPDLIYIWIKLLLPQRIEKIIPIPAPVIAEAVT